MSLRKMLARTLGSVEAFLELCDCYELLGNLAQTEQIRPTGTNGPIRCWTPCPRGVHSPQVASSLARVRQNWLSFCP